MIQSRLLLVACGALAGTYGLCAATTPHLPGSPSVESAAHSGSAPADRRAFFGELHLHTGYSFDAYAIVGTRTTPEDAYRFAKGEPVSYLGQTVQRSRPLDFTAVTDHAEYIGTFNQLDDPNSALSKSETAKSFHQHPIQVYAKIEKALASYLDAPDLNARAAMASAWKREVEAAERNYQPGKFTTFVAYEWTSFPDQKFNLHRNVIFKNTPPEAPFSAADSERPEDLWSYLEGLRARGIEALAIPHNANASGGLMFDWKDSDGHPINEAYAQRRALNEPLTEIYQHKGQSETAPELSPEDEFSNFEVVEQLLTGGPAELNGSYARQALGRGLIIQSRVGTNPYKLGFVGGSDFHNALSNSDESGYAGNLSGIDPKVNLPDREAARHILAPRPSADSAKTKSIEELAKNVPQTWPGTATWSGAGLTGVWAEANTRESIYAALRRRETFATSGPTIRLRFFGGWKVPANALTAATWVSVAYKTDTPMGGDLPGRPGNAGAPGFIVQAAKDPMSGSLDRIQIVKVWLDGGDYREKVFDVVWSPGRKRDAKTGRVPPVQNTVDLKTATYDNSHGAPMLSGVWHDPEFDPAKPAVYYARALEIPTPRWTTLLAVKRDLPLPTHVPATIQERAISSPIWYTPLGSSDKQTQVAP
jgi:Protein of unknown function (DUF3604)